MSKAIIRIVYVDEATGAEEPQVEATVDVLDDESRDMVTGSVIAILAVSAQNVTSNSPELMAVLGMDGEVVA